MELTKEMWAVMSPNLPDVSTILVKRVLASIPEPGALTEGEWPVVENGVDRPTLRKLRSILASRPAPAPEPALCHCYVPDIPHTHEPIPESATMQVERLSEALENLIDPFTHNPLCECKNCNAKAVLIAAWKEAGMFYRNGTANELAAQK